MANDLVGYLKSRNIKYQEDYDLSSISSIKIGGKAKLFVAPNTPDELVDIIRCCCGKGLSYRVVGRLSNVLFSDDYYGVVISTMGLCGSYHDGNIFTFGAGVSLAAALSYAREYSYGGAEQLHLIPGSIGGAIVGNAGAHGMEISDILEWARIYFPDTDELLCLSTGDMSFSYRHSLLKRRCGCVLEASLRLLPKNNADIHADLHYYRRRRRDTQPSLPSLGSVFKRANGVSAGYYIDAVGLKGAKCGGAAISDKHAGFIVNIDRASANDFITLVELAKAKVYEAFGIILEEEVEIL